ncbi:MAG: nucleoside hydrolase [Clostridia bacterium]|nr:nucleoside hydrolase [Clostridia bacterium]
MKPIKLILDTDVGSDCDDVMAISYMIAAEKKGLAEPLAITISHPADYAPAGIRALYRSYGAKVPAMGQMSKENPRDDFYGKKIYEKFGEENDLEPVGDAVALLRKTLAESDGDVTLCAIGPLNNIADLLESKGDDISPLCGSKLVKEKCSKLVLMAGGFIPNENGKNSPEWNVKVCIDSSKKVFELCKNDIYMLPHEAAHTMVTGKYAVETLGDKTPLTYAFLSFFNSVGRSSWDPATMLWAVEGNRDLFTLSEAGRVTVDDIGTTDFCPDENGNCYIIGINRLENESFTDAQKRAAAYIDGAVNEILGI